MATHAAPKIIHSPRSSLAQQRGDTGYRVASPIDVINSWQAEHLQPLNLTHQDVQGYAGEPM